MLKQFQLQGKYWYIKNITIEQAKQLLLPFLKKTQGEKFNRN